MVQKNKWVAPLNIPVSRRRQTLAVLIWSLIIPICLALSVHCMFSKNSIIFYSFLLYLLYINFFQVFHEDGGRRSMWVRRLLLWKWMARYFPVTLIKTSELSISRKYIFGYHPHGIISLGAITALATEGPSPSFEEHFPGINIRVLTLAVNFYLPFLGLLLTKLGVCSCSKRSCNSVLNKGNGNAIALVLGGAKESLDSHVRTARLTLKHRKGFVKVALRQGADLVPIFCFGETDLFDQAENPRGSLLRRIQASMQSVLGFAVPIFKGRGVFNYVFGFLPQRRPLYVVVGTPIVCMFYFFCMIYFHTKFCT
eukprot:GSMAST32.ASY1.ANO1.1182.1 assembled CDS